MVRYRRNFVAGGTFFFTVTLLDRKEDFERHVDDIHFNPVKHALVSRLCDWPYSSFHRYVRQGVLPEDWGGDVSGIPGGFGERHR
jgi:putative transposase